MNQKGHVCLRIKGGLGNQLFEYAFAKSLSIDLGFKLIIDSDTGFLKDNYSRESKIKFFLKEHVEASNFKKLVFFITKMFPFLAKRIFSSRLILEKNSRQLESIDILELQKFKIIYVEGYFQSYRYFDYNWSILIKNILIKINSNFKIIKLLKDIQENKSICIHIRRIDYEQKLDLKYYKEGIEYYLSKDLNCMFFIFSDDIVWCKENFNFLENKVFVTDLGGNEVSELYLMSHFNHYIIANSSFSWWGAYLSESTLKTVLAPKNSSIGVINHYYPEDWILI
jgi:hypothetical protein